MLNREKNYDSLFDDVVDDVTAAFLEFKFVEFLFALVLSLNIHVYFAFGIIYINDGLN